MAKLTLFVFGIFAIAIGFFNTAETLGEGQQSPERDGNDAEEETDRSGALAIARTTSITATAGISPRYSMLQHNMGLVECYACTDCPTVFDNTTTKMCPRTLDPSKQSTCVVYAEKYKHLKKSWFIRGCATERGSCADIKQAHAGHSEIVKLLLCNECEGDRCNTSGASRSFFDFTMALVTLVLVPLVSKYTLS